MNEKLRECIFDSICECYGLGEHDTMNAVQIVETIEALSFLTAGIICELATTTIESSKRFPDSKEAAS